MRLSVRKNRRDFPHELSFVLSRFHQTAWRPSLLEFWLISLEEANKIKWKTQQKDQEEGATSICCVNIGGQQV